MVNNLCYWCRNIYGEEDCKGLCLEGKKYDMLDFISDNLPKSDNMNKEIQYKRKTIKNIKLLDETNNYLANKRNYYNFIKIERQTKYNLIYLIILLVLAICFGLFCIYYYFLIK